MSFVLMLLALSGCGGHRSVSTGRDLALERADLTLVGHALQAAEVSVEREVRASQEAWPLIAHGLPTEISPSLELKSATASIRVSEISAPSFMTQTEGPATRQRRDLTGPSAGIAGLFQSFSDLSEHGWKLTRATIEGIKSGSKTDIAFLRSNVGLYLTCLYDGHFDLSSIGKGLLKAYGKLGAGAGFGASLTEGEIEKLASFYSAQLKLTPHVIYKIG